MRQRLSVWVMVSLLRLRAQTVIRGQTAWRRLMIALSSGAKQKERRAAFAWSRGEAATAIPFWRDLEREQPSRATWPLKISQAEGELGDFGAAESTLRDARERGVSGEALELAHLRYSRLNRRSNAAIDETEAVVADRDASPEKLFFSAFYLTAHNRLASARAGFERILSTKAFGRKARGQLAAVALLEEARAKGRPEISGWVSPAENSILVREPSSDTLVVGFVLPSGALGLPMNALHEMLSSTGVNALYLYDSQMVYHLNGADRFGPGYQAMLDGIRAAAKELGTHKLITVGGSATGYTAIRAGMDLGADGALAFSPATLMLSDANPGNARGATNLVRLRERALPMMQDLGPLVRNRKTCPRIEIYYGASNRRDIMHVNNIAGSKGVVLHPVPAFGQHDCLTEMAARGYRDLLSAF